MRDPENILEVSGLHPDYMGFIFYPGSKRAVGKDFKIVADFPGIKRVGVFVMESTATMLEQTRKHNLDFVQLHGDETPAQCQELGSGEVKVIKTFSVGPGFDFAIVEPYKEYVSFFLFDTKGEGYGGTGKQFDWNLLKEYDQQVPFFLSGGISPENIHEVAKLKGMNIHAVDVNSGVESAPGLKDVHQIEKLQRILLNEHWLEY